MKKTFLSSLFLCFGLLSGSLFFVQKANADTLANVKDTITTSRPSASTPVNEELAASATQVTVYNNKSIFLASDSAKFVKAGVWSDTMTIASQSAAQTVAYFTGATSATHNKTEVLVTAITAKHTVTFTTRNGVPSNGTIQVIFNAGDTSNPASPSASGWSFNGLASGNISISGGPTCGSWTITPASGLVQCNLSAAITTPTAVTITIGSSTPAFINPTKTAAAGTADTWTVLVKTKDSSSIDIDTAKLKIGTIESVWVQATVDPTLTFSIAGITDPNAINTGNATGCTNTETTNTGITSTATTVDLGTLSNTPTAVNVKVSNIAAQLITITTNAMNGYALTATSSGRLIDPATGFFIASNTTVAVFPNGTPWFGIHPCGLDVDATTWTETGANQNCSTHITGSTANECKYGWPTQATWATTLASDTTGPIGNSLTAGNGLVSVEYAAGVDASVPAGLYRSVITYVATPTF